MTMDCNYFKCHIEEELEGAKAYARMAMEIKAMSTAWHKLYLEMATQELSHAKNFYDMFTEYYEKIIKPYSEPPQVLKQDRRDIVEMYTKCYAEAKVIIDMAGK